MSERRSIAERLEFIEATTFSVDQLARVDEFDEFIDDAANIELLLRYLVWLEDAVEI